MERKCILKSVDVGRWDITNEFLTGVEKVIFKQERLVVFITCINLHNVQSNQGIQHGHQKRTRKMGHRKRFSPFLPTPFKQESIL